jgi:hypothetical protein
VPKIVGAGFRDKYFRYAARAGCHWVRREDAKRLKDLERENATRKRFLADAELYPHDPDATLRPLLSQYAKDHRRRGFDPRIRTPAQKARQSIPKKCNAFGAKKGFECPSAAPAQRPRQLHRP